MARQKTSADPILSLRIKTLRKKHKITQEKLAADIGVTDQTIRKYESGKFGVPYSSIVAIAKVLNCHEDYLLGLTPIESREEYEKAEAVLDAFGAYLDPIYKHWYEKREQEHNRRSTLLRCIGGFSLKKDTVTEEHEEIDIFSIQTVTGKTYQFKTEIEFNEFFEHFIEDTGKLLRFHLFEFETKTSEETLSNSVK